MKNVVIAGSPATPRIVPFYLAVEEWVAANLPAGDWFFAWQTPPSAICGRHQDIAAEVDLAYARERGIQVWRRRSGGGCVYSDSQNVMFSLVTDRCADVQGSFSLYTEKICAMLGTLDIHAEPTGRNDVAVDGRKVAGNAWYRSSGRSIVHGTMLVDADPATMSRLLTPSRAKLESKGVQSVPARITTLRACGLAMPAPEFMAHATSIMCPEGSYTLSEADIAECEKIMAGYLDPEYLRIHDTGRRDYHKNLRIGSAGEVCVMWNADPSGLMTDVRLSGDLFADDQALHHLCLALRGRSPECLTAELVASLLTEPNQKPIPTLKP